MRTLTGKIRTCLVAVLALVLLLGPCLSINGLAGAGTAHAHGLSAQPASGDHAAGTHHDHAQPSKHSQDKSDSSPGCEEMCDGWAVQKTKRDLADAAPVMQKANGFDIDGDNTIAVIVAYFPIGPPDTGRNPQSLSPQDGWLASVSDFALTNRYRL